VWVVWLWAGAARAQSFEQFTPTPAGDFSLGVESAGIETEGVAASVVLDYARDPVLLRSGGERVGAILSDQLAAHVGVSAALHGRVVFFVNAPFILHQTGDDPHDARTGFGWESPSGSEFGNVSVGARVALRLQRPGSVGVALSSRFFFPSGDQESYVNESSPPSVFSGLIGASEERWWWAIQVGLAPPFDIWDEDTETFGLRFGAAFAYFLEHSRRAALGAELRAAQPLDRYGWHEPSVEALAEGRLRLGEGDWFLYAAAGPGLTQPVGVPLFRALLGLSYAPGGKRP
jgi:hypothetical protein